MSRPPPRVILRDDRDRHAVEVCTATATYAVYYQDEPIKIRTHGADNYSGYKYKKVSFPEPGHAVALAKRLNRRFNTLDFTVRELRPVREIPLM